jgi:hypothetical protein
MINPSTRGKDRLEFEIREHLVAKDFAKLNVQAFPPVKLRLKVWQDGIAPQILENEELPLVSRHATLPSTTARDA